MELRKECANAIRALTMDAIDKSKSYHPGAPMGMANMAEALWRFAYKHNPKIPAGSTVTVLFCPTGTPQCFFTAFCT